MRNFDSMDNDEKIWRLEEEFYAKDRKVFRKERKRLSEKDRSQFKKTDQDQSKKNLLHLSSSEEGSSSLGRVLRILPEGALVSYEKQEWICQLKGALKQEKRRVKNLIAVGDFVRIEKRGNGEGVIVAIEPRRSVLSRADNLARNKEHLIAVNIDQVLIVASLVLPRIKPFLIDRYIIATLKGKMDPVILMNKIDLLKTPPLEVDPKVITEELELYEECLKIYQGLGFKVIPISAKTGEGVDVLQSVMTQKASVFSGQSGVGKSSLINELTGSAFAVGGIVNRTQKGSHKTTTAQLVSIANGGFCIDTPGIKSFGLWDLRPEDIAAYYPEIVLYSTSCKYPDCAHLHEPGCAVKEALEEGRISSLRFASYCALMSSLSEKHRHR